MAQKKSYVLIVAHQAGSSLKKISLPLPFIYFVCMLALFTGLGAIYATFGYLKMSTVVSDYDKLVSENKRVKIENQTYKILTDQVGEKISSLEITSKKLGIISGLEPLKPRQGGTGGVTFKNGLPVNSNPPAQSLEDLRRLTEKIPNLEARYSKLNEFYKEQFLLNIHTPSVWPVRGYVSRGFGPQHSSAGDVGEYHAGMDISAPFGNKVIAPAAGVVIFAGYRKDYGNLIVLSHKLGYTTLYGHLSRINVNLGQRVERYQTIGLIGSTGRSTGPHLHYEVRINNRLVNPTRFIKEDRQIG